MPEFDANRKPPATKAGAVETLRRLAKRRGTSFTAVADTPEGRHILALAERLPADSQTAEVSPQGAAPDYLVQAAHQIAKRDRIPVEVAFAKVARERPELAKRYRFDIE